MGSMRNRLLCLAGACAALVALVVFAALPGNAQQQDRKSWKDYGGGPDNSHYLDLTQINKSNVKDLQVAWTYPTHDGQSYLFNPVVIDNVAYVLARNTSLVALDATTGKELWVHEKMGGITGRGINYWESKDRKDRRLIFCIHQQLQEIDATTGKSILTFGDNGYVNLREGIDRDPNTFTNVQSGTPGKVFENLIILGTATGDFYMAPHGDVRAYNVLTGKLAWQFHSLPRPGDPGYDTWPKDAYKYIGGINTWGELSVDEKRGIAYVPTSEPAYGFYGAARKGENLYANSVVALNARTGKLIWYFQEVHHDLWDYDLVSAPQLLTIQHDGKSVDVVAHAGKTGFLYVLDRVTGKPIWPIEERPVPPSTMSDEQAWPTQPFPTKPPPFARQSMTVTDVNPYLPPDMLAEAKKRVAASVNTGLFTPPGEKETMEIPGNRGGSNWGTTGSEPSKGIMFVLSVDAPSLLQLSPAEPGSGGIGSIAAGMPGVSPGEVVYGANCAACHGASRTGNGDIPSLVAIGTRMSDDQIRGIIQNGRGRMPPRELTDTQIGDVISYLTSSNGRGGFGGRGRGGAGGATGVDPALVVGSGGAPAGDAAEAQHPNVPRPMMNGPAYPAGVQHAERYFSGWNVEYDLIKPPWNTLTAYDLNRGTILWQIPIGDPPGVLYEQRGVLSTAGGLVFVAEGDGKVKAYDDETGEMVWDAALPGGNRSIPAIYQAKGREYLVISATQPIEATPGAQAQPAAAPTDAAQSQRGYIAFALPEKNSQ